MWRRIFGQEKDLVGERFVGAGIPSKKIGEGGELLFDGILIESPVQKLGTSNYILGVA